MVVVCLKVSVTPLLVLESISTLSSSIFVESASGKFLKDTGALPYVEKTLHYTALGYQWAEVNVPIHYKTAKDFIVPYVNFCGQLAKIGFNLLKDFVSNATELIKSKIPLVTNFIEQYAPGLPQKIQNFTISAWTVITDVTVSSYKSGCDFFKTKVFIGQLSPENLSKALNQTQIRAAEYYSWFNSKVDSYAKLK